MKDAVKFSIIVPVYKAEAYLDECIKSVLGQSYQNFELILIDDGSPDNSGAICDSYAKSDSRLRVLHKPNSGAFHSRCCGLEMVTGDYVLFLDSDDYIDKGSLEMLSGYIAQYGADCIIYGLKWLKESGTEEIICHEAYQNRLITDKAEVFRLVMCDGIYNSLCRKCVRASCFRGRDFSACYHIRRGEDRIQSEEILENAASFLFIPETPYFYRVNPGSVTHDLNMDGYRASFVVEQRSVALIERLGLFTEEDYDRLRNHLLDAQVIELKRLSRHCSSNWEVVKAIDSIRSHSFFESFLSPGYRVCSDIPGITISRGLRRRLNSLLVTLLGLRQYGLIIFICRHVFKAR